MAKVAHFFDERFAIDFLAKVPQLNLPRSGIVRCDIVPLKVKEDKKRGIFLFKLFVRTGDSLPTTPVSVIGKFRRSAKDKQTFEVMGQLWERGFGAESHLRISEPVAYIEDWRLLLSYRANGLTLEHLLEARHGSATTCVAQAAQWLAQLHQTVITSPKARSVQDEAEHLTNRFERTIEKFQKKHPSLVQRAQRVAEEIVNRVKNVGSNSFTLTHGDYLPKNVVSDGSNLTVIDLGGIRLFDPAKDVGRFIGHVTVKAWDYAPSLQPEALRELFLRVYAEEYSAEFSERIAAYESRCYLRRSPREYDLGSARYWLQKAEEGLAGLRREPLSEGATHPLTVFTTIRKA